MMLRHLGEADAAQRIEDAVFVTLEEGRAVTLDVARQTGDVEQATSTTGFADAIIANLGRAPSATLSRAALAAARARARAALRAGHDGAPARSPGRARRRGCLCRGGPGAGRARRQPDGVAAGPDFRLELISARGHRSSIRRRAGAWTASRWWRCGSWPRADDGSADDAAVVGLLGGIGARVTWMHVEKLRTVR